MKTPTMNRKVWITAGYAEWYAEKFGGYVPMIAISTSVTVLRESNDGETWFVEGSNGWGAYIPKQFIEFIPPMHVEFHTSWDDYTGLRLITPKRAEIIIDDKQFVALPPARLGHDLASATKIAHASGFDITYDDDVIEVVNSFYGEDANVI
ncbi:MAG: hypothetical protein AAFN11_00155 [Chloroflexota bacterium]